MPRKVTVKTENAKENIETNGSVQPEAKNARKPKVHRLEPHTLVEVKNGFNGLLVYVSPRTGERFLWDGFGAVVDMELQDLRSAKSAHKEFFLNNWFMISDNEVLADLGVERMYENSLTMEDFDELFELPADKLKERLVSIPNGQKPSVIYRAKQLIEEGKIDSLKTIGILESCLGVELIEK